MKTKYLKGITAMSFAATVLLFSSCLKDDARVFDPLSVQSNVAELPLSGLNNFAKDAITTAGTSTITFAVGVTAKNPPAQPTVVTIGVDNSLIATYNAANPAIVYQPLPAAAYTLASTTITIPAGKNSTTTTVVIDRTSLDPALSYMLPIKVVSAPAGVAISANYGVHYYHIIGNDFAGAYRQDYTRYNLADTVGVPNALSFTAKPVVISPVSPTQFEVPSGYLSTRYEVKFTKGGTAAAPTYTGVTISMNTDDVAANWTPSGIAAVGGTPKVLNFDATNKIFRFYLQVHNTPSANDRSVIDIYYK